MSKCRKDYSVPCQSNDNVSKAELFERIRSLAFVKQELILYLDTHPNCKVALDYFYQTVDALKSYVDEYEEKYGPLTAAGNRDTEEWTWVKEPWPWHRDSDVMNGKWKGEGR